MNIMCKIITSDSCVWKTSVYTIGGEANCGTLWFVRVRVVQAGVAALVLDGDGLDGELAVGQGGAEPDPPLVRRLDHGVAALRKGGHSCGVPLRRSVPPYDLSHLLGQTKGARERRLLAHHRRLVAVHGDLCWE